MVLSWSVVAAERAGGFHLLPFQRAIIQDKPTSSSHVQNGKFLITAVCAMLAHKRLPRYAAFAPAGASAI